MPKSFIQSLLLLWLLHAVSSKGREKQSVVQHNQRSSSELDFSDDKFLITDSSAESDQSEFLQELNSSDSYSDYYSQASSDE